MYFLFQGCHCRHSSVTGSQRSTSQWRCAGAGQPRLLPRAPHPCVSHSRRITGMISYEYSVINISVVNSNCINLIYITIHKRLIIYVALCYHNIACIIALYRHTIPIVRKIVYIIAVSRSHTLTLF